MFAAAKIITVHNIVLYNYNGYFVEIQENIPGQTVQNIVELTVIVYIDAQWIFILMKDLCERI